MADFQFPLLSKEQIVNFFRDFGLEITESTIRKPDGLTLKKIYGVLIELFVGTPADQGHQPMLYDGIQNEHPELHEEDNALMFYYHDLNRVLLACGINNFEPWDIIEPTSKRLIFILSGAINCYLFKETRLEVFKSLQKENEHFREQHDHLLKANEELRKRVARGRQLLSEREPRSKEVRGSIDSLTKHLEGLHKQCNVEQKSTNQVKKEICEKTAEKDQQKVVLMNLEKEKEELGMKIVQSPDRVKLDQEKQISKVAELKTLCQEKVTRLTSLRQRVEWLQRVEDNPDQLLKLLHSIQQAANKENEEVKKSTKLQDRITELGQQVAESLRHQEQMRQRKQVRQEKLDKHRLQHQAKHSTNRSRIEHLGRQREEYCRGDGEKGETMRQKLKLLDEERKAEMEHLQLRDKAVALYSQLILKVDEMHTGCGKAWDEIRQEFQK